MASMTTSGSSGLLNEREVVRRTGIEAISQFLNVHTSFAVLRASGKVVVFDGSSDTGTGKDQFDAEGVMVDSRDEIVIGSDNGLDLNNGGHRFDDKDSKVLVAPTEEDGSGLHA